MADSAHPPRFGLARALSKLGYCSRSRAFELIRSGRVQINGKVHRNPEGPVNLNKDQIHVDGHPVTVEPKIYLVLNKPRGVVTTTSDEQGRRTVYDCLDKSLPHLSPVGRLDQASEGLILLTNDSEWAARVLAPETHLPKTYHVQVGVVADPALVAWLRKGVQSGRDFLRAKRARILRGGEKNTWLEIVLEEGKNRHIRRMFAELGIGVLCLVRVAIGPLPLGDLAKGHSRALTVREKQSLDAAMKKPGKA